MKRCKVRGTIVNNDDKWVYDWFGIEATAPMDIEKVLDAAGGEEVIVDINSGGGSLFAGIEMYSLIQRYQGKISTEVLSMAGSAASVIATAAHCKMHAPAMMMIHNVQGRATGDFNEMDKESQILQKANISISKAYQEKTGKSEEELLEIMNRESWLTSDEAVELGFADEVIRKAERVELFNAANTCVLPREVIEKIRNNIRPEGKEPEEKRCSMELEMLNLLKLQEVM